MTKHVINWSFAPVQVLPFQPPAMQQALRAAARKLLPCRGRALSAMLCVRSFRGVAVAGGGAFRATSSALSSRPLFLRAPLFQHQPSHFFRTLGVPHLTVVNVSRTSNSPAAPVAPPSFEQLGLQAPLVSALQGMSITQPTDIQVRPSLVDLHRQRI